MVHHRNTRDRAIIRDMPDLVATGDVAPRVAMWDHPLADPNLEDARFDHALSSLAGKPLLGALERTYRKRFRHKSWQYMTAVSPDCFIAFVVGGAGFAGNGFVYVVERDGRYHERFAITPLSRGTHVSSTSTEGHHRFHGSGLDIDIDNLDGGRRFDVVISAGHNIRAELTFTSAPSDEHFSLCVPLPDGRWNYTHKFGAFAVTGHVEVGGRRLPMQGGFGTMDFTKMYALRHAIWRWIALCGRSKQGAVVGVNLVDPTPPASFSENCAWIDGKRHPLEHVTLSVDGPDIDARWTLRADGLELSMSPLAHYEQKLDVPLVKHRLRHVVGPFSGTVLGHELTDIIAIAEDNDTWW